MPDYPLSKKDINDPDAAGAVNDLHDRVVTLEGGSADELLTKIKALFKFVGTPVNVVLGPDAQGAGAYTLQFSDNGLGGWDVELSLGNTLFRVSGNPDDGFILNSDYFAVGNATKVIALGNVMNYDHSDTTEMAHFNKEIHAAVGLLVQDGSLGGGNPWVIKADANAAQLSFFGAPLASQVPSTPVTLGDVIALLQGYGLCP